jgi:hypothetical protein
LQAGTVKNIKSNTTQQDQTADNIDPLMPLLKGIECLFLCK